MVSMPAISHGGVHPRTVQSLFALRLPKKENRVFFMPCDRPTTSARSDTLRNAKEFGVDSVLFIDSDMEFEPDAYEKLKKVPGDIVCGLFYCRATPSYPTIVQSEKAEDGKTDRLRVITPNGKVMDVDGMGMAFTLIRKPVIQWAEYPAFQHLGFLSEDFMFCLKARQAGFALRCDTSLRISHRGDIGFSGQPALTSPDSGDLSYPFGITRERERWVLS